jgi:uncharacterized protein
VIQSPSADEKERRLLALLTGLRSVVVAFSGGVDSAYLAWAATRALGASALCVTADSPSYPDRHRQLALNVARDFALRHEVIQTAELERPEYRANPANRCYYCKHELYTALSALAAARGFDAIADGSNADDRGDYRPGRQAAREFGVRSPLDDLGLTKADIRALSRRVGLPTWDEPASACLSSRIPYHSEVTDGKLRMIERAEAAVRALGFRVCRVRHHERVDAGRSGVPGSREERRPGVPGSREERRPGVPGSSARVEIGRDELPRAMEPSTLARIVRDLVALGYEEVTVDPKGYRMGSLNEGLRLRPV